MLDVSYVRLASPHTRGWTAIERVLDVRVPGFPAHAGMDPTAGRPTTGPARLPRTRGDGPRACAAAGKNAPASPHTRGWTRAAPVRAASTGGFPAHAGMDPRGTRAAASRPGLPRTRGDGPDAARVQRQRGEASPHTRGWTRRRRRAAAGDSGFPAHAGMDLARPRSARQSARLPRTRGDGPCRRTDPGTTAAASPHTRGWTAAVADDRGQELGFPAHAGMDPSPPIFGARSRRLPRTRGDGPSSGSAAYQRSGASPHTRGWTRTASAAARRRGGFPAHAGMDPPVSCSSRTPRRLPRTRGDGPVIEWQLRDMIKASPHTRGWTRTPPAASGPRRGFPAHAGMDPARRRSSARAGWLPRTRGDGPVRLAAVRGVLRASPHTRGWTLGLEAHAGRGRGFPAHAGMDPAPGRRSPARPGLPRTRGDGPGVSRGRRLPGRASPHTRGWTRRSRRSRARLAEARGFPAHAGMDPARGRRPASVPGLPRTRGDGPQGAPRCARRRRASPHTRGWTRSIVDMLMGGAGFPAHAGMDPRLAAGPGAGDRLPRTRGDGPRYGG